MRIKLFAAFLLITSMLDANQARDPKTLVIDRIKVVYLRSEVAVLAEYRPEKQEWIVVPTGVWKGAGPAEGEAVFVGAHADSAGAEDGHKERALVCFFKYPQEHPNRVFFITDDHLQNVLGVTTEELKAYLQKKEPNQLPEPTVPSGRGSP